MVQSIQWREAFAEIGGRGHRGAPEPRHHRRWSVGFLGMGTTSLPQFPPLPEARHYNLRLTFGHVSCYMQARGAGMGVSRCFVSSFKAFSFSPFAIPLSQSN